MKSTSSIYELTIKRIHDKVLSMDYSQDNFLDCFCFIDQVINLTEKQNSKEFDKFLFNVKLTRENFLDVAQNNEFDKEDGKYWFDKLKYDFLADFHISLNF